MPVYSSEKALTISSVESEWVKVRLGDMCEIYQPETISKKEMCSNGAFPVFGANGKIGYYDRYNHEKPEVLVCCRGATCGTVNMSEPRSWITGNAMVVHPKDEQLNQSFLYYLLMGGVSLSKCITGTAQPQITKANLTPVKIPLPPLPEQRRISTLLGSIEKAIDLERRCEESLTTIKRAVMHVVFTPANTAGWEKIKLGEILKLEYGKPLPKEDRCNHGGFPAFGANGILCWSKKAYRNEPSIIVGRKGSAGEVNLTNGPFYPTDVTFFVVHNEKKALLKYLYYLLIQLNLKRLVQGIKPGINRNDVYALNTYIPPLHEQQEIVDFLTTLDQKLDIHRRKRACLENIFRLFLPNLTRGTLRFTDLPEGCF